MKSSHPKGFTVIELMVTVMVMSITVMIAAPGLKQTIQNNRVTTQANELLAALNYARSEAVKRGVQVTVCKANLAANPGQCDKNANVFWESGKIVFVDQNTLGVIDAGGGGAGADTILRVYSGMPSGYTLRSGATFANWIAYLPSGASQGSSGLSNDTFRMCPPNHDVKQARSIVLNAAGRPMVSKGATQCP